MRCAAAHSSNGFAGCHEVHRQAGRALRCTGPKGGAEPGVGPNRPAIRRTGHARATSRTERVAFVLGPQHTHISIRRAQSVYRAHRYEMRIKR